MNTRRHRILMALGVLYLLVSLFLPLSVKADNLKTENTAQSISVNYQTDEGFLWPYYGTAGSDYFITQYCHSDGWGRITGVGSNCAVDFTTYSVDPYKQGLPCGEPAMAPVSGQFTNMGVVDKQNNTGAMIDGDRYKVFFLHGDFISSGPIKLGEVFGYEASHGNSSGCHWHITVFDEWNNQWVNPLNLQLVSAPQGAGIAPRGIVEPGELPDLPVQQFAFELPFDMSGHSVEVTPTPVVIPTQTVISPEVPDNSDDDWVIQDVPWDGEYFDIDLRKILLIAIVVVCLPVLAGMLIKVHKQ